MSDVTAEGAAFFWKLFGGTIIGGIMLLGITLINSLNGSISESRGEISTLKEQIRNETSALKERIVKIESAIAEFDSLKTRLMTIEQSREVDKERRLLVDEAIKTLQAEVKDISKQIVELSPKE